MSPVGFRPFWPQKRPREIDILPSLSKRDTSVPYGVSGHGRGDQGPRLIAASSFGCGRTAIIWLVQVLRIVHKLVWVERGAPIIPGCSPLPSSWRHSCEWHRRWDSALTFSQTCILDRGQTHSSHYRASQCTNCELLHQLLSHLFKFWYFWVGQLTLLVL